MKYLLSFLSLVFSIFFFTSYVFAQDSTGFHALGAIHLPDQAWDIAVQGNYAYVVCDDSGLCIVNITNVRSPTLTSHLALSGWAQGIAIQNGFAYIAYRFGGISIVDISSPTQPVLMTSYEPVPMNVRGVFVRDSILYAVSDNYGLYTFSISNPDTVRLLGSVSLDGYRVVVVDTLAYVVGTRLEIVNVKRPDSLFIINTASPPAGVTPYFHNLAISGHFAFCTNYNSGEELNNGIYSFDITDAFSPIYLSSDRQNLGTRIHQGPFGIAASGNTIFESSTNYIQIVDASNSDSLYLRTEYGAAFGHAWNIVTQDTFVYVATDSGLKIFSYIQPVSAVRPRNDEVPKQATLLDNYPNPFNPTTTIRYSIPSPGLVDLRVFNVTGQEITMLIHEREAAGSYAVKLDSSKLPSGVYFYRLETNRVIAMKKMVLVK